MQQYFFQINVMILALVLMASQPHAEVFLQDETLIVEAHENAETGQAAVYATLVGSNQQADFTLSCFNKTDLIAIFWFPGKLKSTGRVNFQYASDEGKFRKKRGYLSAGLNAGSRLVVEKDHTRGGGMAPMIFLKRFWGSDSLTIRFDDKGVEIKETFDLKRFNQFWFGRILEECGRRSHIGSR